MNNFKNNFIFFCAHPPSPGLRRTSPCAGSEIATPVGAEASKKLSLPLFRLFSKLNPIDPAIRTAGWTAGGIRIAFRLGMVYHLRRMGEKA